jgi:hypothetical protein
MDGRRCGWLNLRQNGKLVLAPMGRVLPELMALEALMDKGLLS